MTKLRDLIEMSLNERRLTDGSRERVPVKAPITWVRCRSLRAYRTGRGNFRSNRNLSTKQVVSIILPG